MLRAIKRKLFGSWIEWKEYRGKIEFIEDFVFQQTCRRESIENIDSF
jgi:hypothetical protein